MPFPYAYYRDYFDGPLHGESFKGQALYIESSENIITTSGVVDVQKRSHILVDTSLGDVEISGFENSTHGQFLFIHKITTANNLILVAEDASATEKIYTSNRQDLAFGAGQFGGAIFSCIEDGGVFKWRQVDSNGLIADGTSALPSLAFASDPDTGMYLNSPNKIGFTASGVDRLTISSLNIASLLPHLFVNGSVTFPSISFRESVSTGFWKDSEGWIAASIGGVLGLSIGPSSLYALEDLKIYNSSWTPQRVLSGGLMTSDSMGDAANIPVNGIYSKGNVLTDGQFEGTATSALYADLAERYEADDVYSEGTVVILGGEKEITTTTKIADPNVFGVISAKPAFKMNDKPQANGSNHPFVALSGRVPCRVYGPVKKGDRLISTDIAGIAVSCGSDTPSCPYSVIGRALEDKESMEIEMIEITVGRL